MSRVGQQIIAIPPKTEVVKKDGLLVVKGPLGELSREFRDDIEITVKDGTVTFAPKNMTPATRALWGSYASHVKNMIHGVNEKYEKKLLIEGVGLRAEVKDKEFVFALGLSHPVTVAIPEGITATSEKGLITVSGIDKEQVGSFAAEIRALKKPEPYKGKGIRYESEIIRRKQGKKSV